MNKSYLISNLYSGFYWKLGRPVSCNNVWEGSDWFKSLFWLLIRRKTKGRGRHVKRKYASCLHFRVFSAASLYNKNNIAAKWVLHIYMTNAYAHRKLLHTNTHIRMYNTTAAAKHNWCASLNSPPAILTHLYIVLLNILVLEHVECVYLNDGYVIFLLYWSNS